MFPSLSEKYAIDALRYILTKGEIRKTDLLEIITSSWSLDKLIPKLEKDGLINVEVSKMGRKTYTISLTDKGRAVAEQLKRAEEVATGEDTKEPTTFQMPSDWRDRFKGLSAMAHLNVLDDHVAIEEIDSSGNITSVVMVYVRRINSHFELWCEKDESKECRHVDFAWSLPHMRALIEEYLKEGKIKEFGGAE